MAAIKTRGAGDTDHLNYNNKKKVTITSSNAGSQESAIKHNLSVREIVTRGN